MPAVASAPASASAPAPAKRVVGRPFLPGQSGNPKRHQQFLEKQRQIRRTRLSYCRPSLLMLAATAWLYPSQVRALGRRARWVLPALRGIALVALATSLAKPTVLRQASTSERGSILLLVARQVDNSGATRGRGSQRRPSNRQRRTCCRLQLHTVGL